MNTAGSAQSSRPLGRYHVLAAVLVVLQLASFGRAANFPVIESLTVHGTGTADVASGIAYDNHGSVLISGSTAGGVAR